MSTGDLAAAIQSHHELEGERLEHFELKELVGGGGMGAVFRALDTRLNRVVAIKILSPEQAADEEKIRRFRNEAQSAARLDHENVARVYYVGEDRGLHFIAFEYIAGTNIRDLVHHGGPLPAADALIYGYQIAEALAHATSRDVVHRDIKPSNIIITEGGRAKLVDMGLARLHADDRSGADLTASGVTLGTFDYISPEQALDPRDADSRSDIYSLGCTLYFMLTGQPPFPEGTPLQKLLHHHSEKPPDPRELSASIPDGLANLVQRMMAKDPKRRPESPSALIRELVSVAGEMGLSIPATVVMHAETGSRLRRTIERQLPWLVPVAALLIVVGILESIANFPSGSSARVAVTPPDASPDGSAKAPAVERSAATRNLAAGKSAEEASKSPLSPPDSSAPGASSKQSANSPGGSGSGAAAIEAQREANRSGAGDSAGVTPASEAALPRTKSPVAETVSPTGSPSGAVSQQSAADDGQRRQAVPSSPTGGDPAGAPSQTPAAPDKVSSGAASSPLPNGDQQSLSAAELSVAKQRRDSDRKTAFPDVDATASTVPSVTVEASAFDPLEVLVNPIARSDAVTASDEGTTPRPGSAASLVPAQQGLRIVDPSSSGSSQVHATLRAACAAARDGDVIELRYNGARDERPIEIRTRELTIRAGEGFHPVVRFRPIQTDPLEHPRNMVSVAGGRLTLVNIALELDLTMAMPAEGWSLFQIQQVELARLEHCAMTIRNMSDRGGLQHADVNFFTVVAPPGTASMIVMAEDPVMPQTSAIELKDSVARGEAVFLRIDDLQPASLSWQNGFLATSEWLLVTAGGAKEPQHTGRIELDLRHLTVAARQGFCLLTNSIDAPYQLKTTVRCTDSIVIHGPQGALIEQSGEDSVADFRGRLKWESVRNFYDGFSVFWKIRSKSVITTEEMTLHSWNAFWGGRGQGWGRVVWRNPPDLIRPPHLQTVADFLISERKSDNPARRGASDGRDAGCEPTQLSSFPDSQLDE